MSEILQEIAPAVVKHEKNKPAAKLLLNIFKNTLSAQANLNKWELQKVKMDHALVILNKIMPTLPQENTKNEKIKENISLMLDNINNHIQEIHSHLSSLVLLSQELALADIDSSRLSVIEKEIEKIESKINSLERKLAENAYSIGANERHVYNLIEMIGEQLNKFRKQKGDPRFFNSAATIPSDDDENIDEVLSDEAMSDNDEFNLPDSTSSNS